jgi:hypothetical protein
MIARRVAVPALAAVVVLAVLLVVRLAAVLAASPTAARPLAALSPAGVPAPPAAEVPAPHPLPAAGLPIPCWACPEARDWPIAFRTDLDLLAPLGNGEANAAAWFVQFEKDRGVRFEEAKAADQHRSLFAKVGQVLPPDDPLLHEAEPWVDQATMRFYPELLPLEGIATRLPNLLFPLTLARSWIARGMQEESSAAALADFRRAIRLGRLLRQEDVTLIADLVGIACIRIGAEAIYERATRDGDRDLALVAAVVAGEAAPQRLLAAARVTEMDIGQHLGSNFLGRASLDLPAGKMERMVAAATGAPSRWQRIEPMCSLALVRRHGTSEQREQASEMLETLARGDDPIVATQARYLLGWNPSSREVLEMYPER